LCLFFWLLQYQILLWFLHRFPNLAMTLDEVLKSDALFGLSLLPWIFPKFIYIWEREKTSLTRSLDWILFFTDKKIEHANLFNTIFHIKIFLIKLRIHLIKWIKNYLCK
jgi:hypothetical protein